jgi:deoxyribonuclease-4
MVGIQISSLKELDNLTKTIDILQIDAFQLFFSSPLDWVQKNLFHMQSIFSTLKKNNGVKKILIHAPGSQTLEGQTRKIRMNRWKMVREKIEFCSFLGVDGYIVHLQFPLSYPLEMLIAEADQTLYDLLTKVPLILENTVTPGRFGNKLSSMEQFMIQLNPILTTEICLDTAHLFASGYHFEDKEHASQLKTKFSKLFQHTTLIHVNDSKTPFQSNQDWHEHLGKGYLGLGAIGAFLSLFEKDKTFILETPKQNFDDFIQNVTILKGLIEGNSK